MTECSLKETERIDELNDKGLRIIQDRTGFCFGLDSVLLSGFAIVKKGDTVLDLGTGSGVIPLLLQYKTEGAYFTGLELQPEVADMAARSVKMNGLEDRVCIVEGDIKQAAELFRGRRFDVITSNPPYKPARDGLISGNEKKAISRTEVRCSLADVVAAAAALLKEKGRFYMVHRPSRLTDIICEMKSQGFSIRNLRFVHPSAGAEANLVLIEGIYKGRTEVITEPPCIVFDGSGNYTKEMDDIYRRGVMMQHLQRIG